MTLDLVSRDVLLLLAALPLLAWPWPPRRALRVAVVLRALAISALVLALAGLYLERTRPAGGACVVAAVDVSASVQAGGRIAAARWLPALDAALGPEDALGVVAFAAGSAVVAHPASGRVPVAALVAALDHVGLPTGETDLSAAVAAAASLCAAGRQPAVLLLTDGNETQGDALAEAALAEPPVPIFAAAPTPDALPPAVLRRLLVPPLGHERALLPLEAVVENRLFVPLEARLALREDGEPVAERPVTLRPGTSVVALPLRPGAPGHRALEATLHLDADLPAPPGTATAHVTVAPPARVLVATERGSSLVAQALAERGFAAEVVPPPALGRLDGVHAVVLDDVARAAVPDGVVARLERWVAAGGALIVTGGNHVFGDPGWKTSGLAPALPVELQAQTPEPKEREPVALMLVIDRSNSMGYATRPDPASEGEKMEYARRAALAVLDQLGPRDQVGAIAFDSTPYELGALRSVTASRAALAASIRALSYGGGTDFKAALEIAQRQLLASRRAVRHVILLTDGDTNRHTDDHDALLDALARDGITVTAIRIGHDTANLELLDRIARTTGGEFHHVEDAQALPQLMIRDTRRLVDAPGRMVNAPARLGTPGPMLAGLVERDLPRVARWATTRLRPDAELRLWLDAGTRRDPLLATWQYELGRVAVLPVDFQSGAAEWAGWPGFAKLWAQVLLWTLPEAIASERRLEARWSPAGTRVRLDTAIDEEGPFALRPAGGTEVVLRRTGRRRFEALVPALEPGLRRATFRGPDASRPITLFVPDTAESGREQRAAGIDLPRLRALAAVTGGGLDPTPDTLLAARPGVAREVLPLDVPLAVLALVALLGDVALRRLG